MKFFAIASVAAVSMSSMAFADGALQLRGSTTIAGVMTDAITQAGLQDTDQLHRRRQRRWRSRSCG